MKIEEGDKDQIEDEHSQDFHVASSLSDLSLWPIQEIIVDKKETNSIADEENELTESVNCMSKLNIDEKETLFDDETILIYLVHCMIDSIIEVYENADNL